jgi:hypothetical protein
MENLKSLPTAELYALWSFSKQMLSFWMNCDKSIEKYYKTVSDDLMNEINRRIEILYPELSHLIE